MTNAPRPANEDSVTPFEWLDAAARGTSPLPRYSMIPNPPRWLRVVGSILKWIFTLVALLILGLGTLYSGLLIATWEWIAPVLGYYIWLGTMVIVAALGTLAFICAGRFLQSVIYLVASLIVNYLYVLAQFGFASLEPLLMIPPALLLNGAYLYGAWRLILSPRAHPGDSRP
jgi:hypothetical protein